MKLSELTQKQLERLADLSPERLATYRPERMTDHDQKWLAMYRPEILIKLRPDWTEPDLPPEIEEFLKEEEK